MGRIPGVGNISDLEAHSAIGGHLLGAEESAEAVMSGGLNGNVLPNVFKINIGSPIEIHPQRTPSRAIDLLIPAHFRAFHGSDAPIETSIQKFLLEPPVPD